MIIIFLLKYSKTSFCMLKLNLSLLGFQMISPLLDYYIQKKKNRNNDTKTAHLSLICIPNLSMDYKCESRFEDLRGCHVRNDLDVVLAIDFVSCFSRFAGYIFIFPAIISIIFSRDMNTLEIRMNFSRHQLYTLLECLSFLKKKNQFLIWFSRSNINS